MDKLEVDPAFCELEQRPVNSSTCGDLDCQEAGEDSDEDNIDLEVPDVDYTNDISQTR